jgi:hypothetical protein
MISPLFFVVVVLSPTQFAQHGIDIGTAHLPGVVEIGDYLLHKGFA